MTSQLAAHYKEHVIELSSTFCFKRQNATQTTYMTDSSSTSISQPNAAQDIFYNSKQTKHQQPLSTVGRLLLGLNDLEKYSSKVLSPEPQGRIGRR